VDDLWATKSEGVGLIVHAIIFQDFQPISQTDRQMDRRTDDMNLTSALRDKNWLAV